MSRKIVTITLFSLLIVFALSYVFFLNQDSATVTYRRGMQLTGPMGLVLIFVFCAGAVASTICWLLVGARYYFRERQLTRRTRLVDTHKLQVAHAREHVAGGRYDEARVMLQRIIDRDPNDIVARIELAKSLRSEGKLALALRVLEQARAEQRRNVELLFLAADLNDELSNHTGAFDNMRLVLAADPKNLPALERLVEECTELGRFEEALEYGRQLLRLSPTSTHMALQERQAGLELEFVDQKYPAPSPERRAALEEVLRRHREFSSALGALGELEEEMLQFDAATKLYARAYRASFDLYFLERIAGMWLGADQPSRAFAQVRTLVHAKDLPTKARLEGRMFYLGLLLYLENVEEARKEWEELSALPLDDPRLQTTLELFEALLIRTDGDAEKGFDKLFNLLASQFRVPGRLRKGEPTPSPALTNGTLERTGRLLGPGEAVRT